MSKGDRGESSWARWILLAGFGAWGVGGTLGWAWLGLAGLGVVLGELIFRYRDPLGAGLILATTALWVPGVWMAPLPGWSILLACAAVIVFSGRRAIARAGSP